MDRRLFMLGAPLVIAGCTTKEAVWAPDDQIRARSVRGVGKPQLKLITVLNVGSDNGAHTALLINAPSQRVLWDPAGSFQAPQLPERNDLIYGITPKVEELYYSYHSRASYYTVVQTLDVPAEVAESVLRAAQAYGNVSDARCTFSTSEILSAQPMFQSIPLTYFPTTMHRHFSTLPGVRREVIYENDSDDLTEAARELRERIATGDA